MSTKDEFTAEMHCDDDCFATVPLTRRQFGATSAAAAGVAAAGPAFADGHIVETAVTIETPDGVCDSYFYHPDEGSHAGVLIWTDIRGLRQVFRDMGMRMAAEGYSVLVPNPFYRHAPAPFPGPTFEFSNNDDRQMMMGVMGQLVAPGAAERDAEVFINWLDARDEVDSSKKMATTGYCMGGPLTMRTAGLRPDRIGAAGSFHGGGLVTDKDTSPHLLIPKMQCRYHVAIADNDDEREPDAKNVLRQSFDAANVPATIEVYDGADHGWCVPDSSVYNEAQAERAWAVLMQTIKDGLA
jgi:carboxymethylenebutenolidase